MPVVGIIGGSGLDDPDILENESAVSVETPYGSPSALIEKGRIAGVDVLLLARHGKKHQYSPTQVNYRANIYALKQAGVSHIIGTTACGSLRRKIDRGLFVIVDQFIDFTRFRKNTFHDSFDNGAGHTAMAEPFNPLLRRILYESARKLGFAAHAEGTVVTIEGPRFSTRAESNMFRLWGADVINMSVAPEAMLANELELPYAVVAMSTDYDCWKTDEAPVTWEEILTIFERNADNVKKLLVEAVTQIQSGDGNES